MFNVLDLAWFILRRCANNGTPISNLQLQKILYFLQRMSLQSNGKALFEEPIQAWKFGPVVEKVYNHFSLFSSLRIIPEDLDPSPNLDLPNILLNEIDRRSSQNAWSMVDETHIKGGAWDLIYKNGKGNRKIIPLRLMVEHD